MHIHLYSLKIYDKQIHADRIPSIKVSVRDDVGAIKSLDAAADNPSSMS